MPSASSRRLVAAVAVVVVDAPAARLAVLAAVLALLGWWWASARLDALDRSPLLAEVGRAGRATVVVTAPPADGTVLDSRPGPCAVVSRPSG